MGFVEHGEKVGAATAALSHSLGPSGTWEIACTMETPRGSFERTLVVHLEQDGTTLTGSAEMAAMGRPGGGSGIAPTGLPPC